ncbi:MAG TPA: aldehyde dehydrogenase (NADP(+)) [Saprospiraceae bacterium]|nr:aldehyde dehydrogenase (NADP(+)) [Saprospiraceae bacterium]HMP13070.1 aldehyde dehydrogenase (NADP(+)) [Saprospiraceae bacterium]
MIEQNIIGYELSAQGADTISGFNPVTLETLPGAFAVATEAEVDWALHKAKTAWRSYRYTSGRQRSAFLQTIATELEALGDTLVQRAVAESGLPEARILGERGRTCAQLRLFAQWAEEGAWVEAIIDTPQPERQPTPRPDLRRMLVALGPVVVFTASNFPLAFSTAGGDTASALAAGCPVIVKAHESHPGVHALVAGAIQKAAQRTEMPDGVFSSLYGKGFQLGQALVQHPLTSAVAFTGSYRGGRALFDLANQRTTPIPVFAEMGSTNPIFLLPERLRQDYATLALQIAASVNLGAGQFCTSPGLLVALDDAHLPLFVTALKEAFAAQPLLTMLNPGIHAHYLKARHHMLQIQDIEIEFAASANTATLQAPPAIASTGAPAFLRHPTMHEEVFGPFSLLIKCKHLQEMEQVAAALQGQLSAVLMAQAEELSRYTTLIQLLEEKVGRLVFNGVPTGVEVSHAMQHGGPYPASTDSRFTSVGTAAIRRFVRPVSWQDCPPALLPEALQDDNPLRIRRIVNGVLQ